MENNIKYEFLKSQLLHVQDIKDSEKTKLSLVYYKLSESTCILRECKNRDLSSVYEVLKKTRHPNMAVVYDYVYADGNTYIIEEKINGQSIEKIMEEKSTFSEDETAKIIISICDALEGLHSENPPVIHNDINPSNIMVCDDGRIKLIDFDISRTYKKGNNQNTVLFGTESFASPEHFGYGQSEPRTDIYCLGVTMHKMLTGEVLSNEHRMTYDGNLKNIIKKCLQFDPKDRYASVAVLRKDLEFFLARKKRAREMLLSIAVIIISCIITLSVLMDFDSDDNYAEAEQSDVIRQEQTTDETFEHRPEL